MRTGQPRTLFEREAATMMRRACGSTRARLSPPTQGRRGGGGLVERRACHTPSPSSPFPHPPLRYLRASSWDLHHTKKVDALITKKRSSTMEGEGGACVSTPSSARSAAAPPPLPPPSSWPDHLSKVRASNPSLAWMDCLLLAGETYGDSSSSRNLRRRLRR